MKLQRKSKVTSLQEATSAVKEGSSICLGGLWYHNRAAAFVRELVKRRVGGLTLFSSPPSSYEPDLLIGAGLVKKAYLANMTFEYIGMAPNFRKAAENGEIELVECDESTIVGGLKATIEGIPFHPLNSLKGTDFLQASPLAQRKVLNDGTEFIAAPALEPEVVIIHAQQADEYGNVRHKGAVFADLIMAKAGKTVIVTVDELVSHQEILRDPRKTTIPAYLVDIVVEVPFGAHPSSSHLNYAHDEAHIREYIRAADDARAGRDPEAFHRYLQKYVYEPADIHDYLERVGGLRKVLELRKAAQIR